MSGVGLCVWCLIHGLVLAPDTASSSPAPTWQLQYGPSIGDSRLWRGQIDTANLRLGPGALGVAYWWSATTAVEFRGSTSLMTSPDWYRTRFSHVMWNVGPGAVWRAETDTCLGLRTGVSLFTLAPFVHAIIDVDRGLFVAVRADRRVWQTAAFGLHVVLEVVQARYQDLWVTLWSAGLEGSVAQ